MMTGIESRWVMVEAHSLADLIALAVMAAERLDLRDAALARELTGAAASVRESQESLHFPDMER
ncbi:MAG TPA: hypothetical protein VNC22_23215 [Sporichthya sp.]|jgi:hypothetical protein|nr:hypothetical protein [Sporichthya sp.]